MAISIMIDNLDVEVMQHLQSEAQRRGVEVSTVVKELLGKELGPVAKATASPPYHDLDALAGTWSDEEAEEFLSAIADFERVEEGLKVGMSLSELEG